MLVFDTANPKPKYEQGRTMVPLLVGSHTGMFLGTSVCVCFEAMYGVRGASVHFEMSDGVWALVLERLEDQGVSPFPIFRPR